MVTLNASSIVVNEGAGIVEGIAINGSAGSLCSTFSVRARVPFSPWNTSATTACVVINGGSVTDVYGSLFPSTKQCSTLNHRHAPVNMR